MFLTREHKRGQGRQGSHGEESISLWIHPGEQFPHIRVCRFERPWHDVIMSFEVCLFPPGRRAWVSLSLTDDLLPSFIG
jgi:hypothetical protein